MHGVHFESTRAPRPNSFQTTLAGHYLWNIKMQDPAFSGSETVEHDRQRPACRPDQMVLAAETGSHRGQCAQFRCHRVACASPSEELACTATGRMSDEESLAAKAW